MSYANGLVAQIPNNRQLSQMTIPTLPQPSMTPAQQNHFLSLPLHQQQLFLQGNNLMIPRNSRMYIPTIGQPSIRLAPDGTIRMKQEAGVIDLDVPADIGALLEDGNSGEKEVGV